MLTVSILFVQGISTSREPSTLRSYTRSESASSTGLQQHRRSEERPPSHWRPPTFSAPVCVRSYSNIYDVSVVTVGDQCRPMGQVVRRLDKLL